MRVLAIGPMYNEGEKAIQTIEKFPVGVVDEVLVVDDASTDASAEIIRKKGITVISLEKRSGPGTAIRAGLKYGLAKKYDAFIIFATNGKDNPQEIPQLLAPVKEGRADFVQGSRYLGTWQHMPFHRIWGVRLFSFLFSLFTLRKITDGTNGFRCFRSSLLADKRIDLEQEWLEGYPLETYLFVQAIRLGYRVTEAPVTKSYPPGKKNYTKMRPLLDWWNYFKPVPYLTLGIKK